MEIIFTIGIFTSLFFFILLLNKKNKSLPDRILAFWMLVIGIHLGSTYINSLGYWEIYPHLIGITVPFPFFYGIMLYLYVSYSIQGNQKLKKQDYLHFLPIILSYLYMFRFYFFYTVEQKKMVDKGLIDDFGIFSNILVVLMLVSGISYSLYSYRLLNTYKNLIEDNFSNTERINLDWLKGFIWGVVLIVLTGIIVLLSRALMEISYPFNPDYIFYSMIVFAILCLGYFGIRHENIFTDQVVVETLKQSKESNKNSGLMEELATDKHMTLLQLMDEKKPYLEQNLTLNSLANHIEITPHQLSRIINQFEGQNFNDFVNKYRVEEFIQRVSEDPHFSFLALALDSGFNSKSTFNSVFRKHKGLTPSQYISSHFMKAS